MQVTEILTDHTLMALELRGTPEYPIRFYLDIMDQFDRAGIHWHWHPELEFNVITRGTMEYYVENEHHTLTAGQGIFKNANILHMAQPASHTPDAEMFSVIMDAAFLAPPQSVIYQKYVAPFLGSQGLRSLCLSPQVPWQRQMLDLLRQSYALSQTETGAYELHIHRLMCHRRARSAASPPRPHRRPAHGPGPGQADDRLPPDPLSGKAHPGPSGPGGQRQPEHLPELLPPGPGPVSHGIPHPAPAGVRPAPAAHL